MLLGDPANDMLFGEEGDDQLGGGSGTADNADGGSDLNSCTEVETTSNCEDLISITSNFYTAILNRMYSRILIIIKKMERVAITSSRIDRVIAPADAATGAVASGIDCFFLSSFFSFVIVFFVYRRPCCFNC